MQHEKETQDPRQDPRGMLQEEVDESRRRERRGAGCGVLSSPRVMADHVPVTVTGAVTGTVTI